MLEVLGGAPRINVGDEGGDGILSVDQGAEVRHLDTDVGRGEGTGRLVRSDEVQRRQRRRGHGSGRGPGAHASLAAHGGGDRGWCDLLDPHGGAGRHGCVRRGRRRPRDDRCGRRALRGTAGRAQCRGRGHRYRHDHRRGRRVGDRDPRQQRYGPRLRRLHGDRALREERGVALDRGRRTGPPSRRGRRRGGRLQGGRVGERGRLPSRGREHPDRPERSALARVHPGDGCGGGTARPISRCLRAPRGTTAAVTPARMDLLLPSPFRSARPGSRHRPPAPRPAGPRDHDRDGIHHPETDRPGLASGNDRAAPLCSTPIAA
jgi:hypothetical protein